MWTKRLAAIVMFFIVVCLASGMALAQGTGHTVSDGETLWGLAGRYYNNPWQWKKIYEANRDKINDPHWIYPAQEFSIPGMVAEGVAPEQAVTAETPPAEVTTTGPYGETAVAETSPVAEVTPGAETSPVAEVTPGAETSPVAEEPVAKETPVGGEKASSSETEAEKEIKVSYKKFTGDSFIVPESHSFDGKITGTRDRKTIMAQGDIVYINIGSDDDLTAGSQCYIFRKREKIRGGGYKVIKVGMLKLTGEINEKNATAIITKSYDAVEVGDYVEEVK